MKYHSNNIKTNIDIKNEMIAYLKGLITDKISMKKYNSITIACVGTDRCIGDSLGPITGDFLEEKKWENVNIIGNLECPLHAKNFEERVLNIPKNSLIVAIDACLGNLGKQGFILIDTGSIRPGKGTCKELSPIGDVSIKGIVGLSGNLDFMQNTRLHLVIEMAKIITNILSEVIPFISLDLNMEVEEIIV